MQRNTPGLRLLDRRIGPKDMFIVLLYDCIYSSTVVVYFIKINLRCIIRLRCMHELLIPVSTTPLECTGYTSGVLALTPLSGYHNTPWGVIPKQAYEHP